MHVVKWVVLAVVVLGVVIAIFGWDRYRGSRKSADAGGGSEPTSEVFIDPATGQRMRVWYHPATGDREYRAEASGSQAETHGPSASAGDASTERPNGEHRT
jgi:hypothetical protein